MQGTQFRYLIKFVADMDKAVKFYRDVLGLQVKFESPGWSEFGTGKTTLALHPASDWYLRRGLFSEITRA